VRRLAIIAISILALTSDHAAAWSTPLYSDAEVAQRAELIVIGQVKAGSLVRLLHRGSYEHRAILLISRVIKGEYEKRELPIVIHYGLLPVPARYEGNLNDGSFVGLDHIPPYSPDESIRIYEDNPSEGFFRPSGDVRKDQIWCLRLHREAGVRDYPDIATTDALGVWDPEDIESLNKEQQFKR
jgi:hypothetical protein